MNKVILSKGTKYSTKMSDAKTTLRFDTEVSFVAWSKENGGTYSLKGLTIFVKPGDDPDYEALCAACED